MNLPPLPGLNNNSTNPTQLGIAYLPSFQTNDLTTDGWLKNIPDHPANSSADFNMSAGTPDIGGNPLTSAAQGFAKSPLYKLGQGVSQSISQKSFKPLVEAGKSIGQQTAQDIKEFQSKPLAEQINTYVMGTLGEPGAIKEGVSKLAGATEAEIKRVAGNLLERNPGITQKDAEAMAKDVIANRPFNNASQMLKTAPESTIVPKDLQPLAQEAKFTELQKAFEKAPIGSAEKLNLGKQITEFSPETINAEINRMKNEITKGLSKDDEGLAQYRINQLEDILYTKFGKTISGVSEKGISESQLTDIWNKTNQGVSSATSKEAKMASKASSQLTKQSGQELPPQLLTKETPLKTEVSSLPSSIAPTGNKSIDEEVSGAIDRLNEAIKTSAKPARKELEKAYQAERAKRTGALAGIQEKGQEGLSGYYQQLGALKGPLASTEEKSFSKLNLIEQDINSLMKAAKINPALDVYEKLNTQTALVKVLNGTIPTDSELALLEKTYGPKLIETLMSQRTTGQKILEGLKQITNLPRTIMASFDLSAPFRQGLLLISHPKAFGNAFLTMFRQFGSEEAFKAVQESIAKMPEYALMKQGKLALTDVGIQMTNREEKFMASWAEKIPLIKYPIKASNRAYTGFLNKLRADVFSEIVKGARAGGRELDEKLVKGIADFVNTASGRGSRILGVPIGKSGPLLNGLFFSPRLMASRLTMLNPVEYIKGDPIVRKEMLKSLFTVLGSGMTVLGLAKMAGAKVGDDWRSSDFGKIVAGPTRIDIWGGFQQYVRMAGQLITGQYVSSTTGKITTLGEGYKPLTRFDIALRQVESKEAPVLSFITDLMKQQDYTGKPISIPKEVASRFVPMVLGDMYDLAKQNPELLPSSLLGVFGVGLQTYKSNLKTNLGALEKTLPGKSNLPGLGGSLPKLPGL